MSAITIVQTPRFAVDLSISNTAYQQQKVHTIVDNVPFGIEKVKAVAFIILEAIRSGTTQACFFILLALPLHIVKKDRKCNYIFTIVKGVITWTITIPIIITACFYKVFANEMAHLNHQYSLLKISQDFCSTHLLAKQSKVDLSDIPENFTLAKAIELFDKINFSRPDDIGYIDPNFIRDDDGISLSITELQRSLKHFINTIENRSAIIGAPKVGSADLIPYYENISALVRYSLYQLSQKEENISEDKRATQCAQLLINYAIAGKGCTGRFSGEATQAYLEIISKSKGNPGETIEDILNRKFTSIRLGIINDLIARKIANTATYKQVHSYNQHMLKVAPYIGLPVTQSVDDPLRTSLEKSLPTDLLLKFFNKYTRDFVVREAQYLIATSEQLKTLVNDWMIDQIEDWNNQYYLDRRQTIIEDLSSELWHHLLQMPLQLLSQEEKPSDLLNRVQNYIYSIKKMPEPMTEQRFVELIQEGWQDNLVCQQLLTESQRQKYDASIRLGQLSILTKIKEKLHILSPEINDFLQSYYKKKKENSYFLHKQIYNYQLDKEAEIYAWAKEVSHFLNIRYDLGVRPVEIAEKRMHLLSETSEDIKKFLEKEIERALVVNKKQDFMNEIYTEKISHRDNDGHKYTALKEEVVEWILISHNILSPRL